LDDVPSGLLLGLIALLLLISAFFSISETSMMALNRYRLRHLAGQGHRGARLTSQLLGRTDRLLGVILLGNNLVNAAAAVLVGEMARLLLGDNETALAVATGAVTFLILVFAEITPKVVGAAYPEWIAYPASFVLTPLLKLTHPVVWFINLFVKALLSILRLAPPSAAQPARLSPEELRTLVLEAGHFIPQKHHSILVNLFELEDITVDDIMVPRHRIEAIDLEAPLEEIRAQIATSHHTRLVAYSGQLDNVVGFLHVRKVLNLWETGEISEETLRESLREPYFIPAGTPLFSQLQHFQENHRRMGLVVDEYGELLGLVTMEDILEEMVGEFTSASRIATGFTRQPDGSVLVEGGYAVRELNRKLGLKLPTGGPKTLNGLIIEHLRDIPEPGTSVKIADHPMEIMQTQDRIVKIVRIYPAPEQKQRNTNAGSGG
jgi:Mg2+/Co2+ transporter CorB